MLQFPYFQVYENKTSQQSIVKYEVDKEMLFIECKTFLSTDKEKTFPKFEEKMFDLIFSDPPYGQGLAKMSLLKAAECAIVGESGFWITETHKKEDLPEVAGGIVFWSRRLYGGTAVSFYKRVS